MNNFETPRINDSMCSDDKMETGSESFQSAEHTPSSSYSAHNSEELNGHAENLPQAELTESFVGKMCKLKLNESRSELIATTEHPLRSPDRFPDVVPSDEERGVNGYGFYPEKNTSKNNLYWSEALGTPDVVRRRIAVPVDVTPVVAKVATSTPRESRNNETISDWCDAESRLPSFQLPIEMSSHSPALRSHSHISEGDGDDACSLSNRSDASRVVWRDGRVTLPRRKIQPPANDDQLDDDASSGGAASELEDEEEPPLPVVSHSKPVSVQISSPDDDTRRSSPTLSASLPEYSAAEELEHERSWLSVSRERGQHVLCDMKVIEEYKRAISHGGYATDGSAIIVMSACHLPHTSRRDYTYVMDNLFLYVMWTLERLVTEKYVVVYLHGSAPASRLPSCRWLHRCYALVDRRLRKSLQHLYLVHPTFWLKSFVLFTKPFVSSKFFRKLSYVSSLEQLRASVPVDDNAIPQQVHDYDAARHR